MLNKFSFRKHIRNYFYDWWSNPRLTWWAVLCLGLVLALHKPWALTNPQLYAEDGTVFMKQADWYGVRAFIMPYMGYLSTIPRLVAWFCTNALDPLYWPTFYNLVAFVITVAVAARMLSERLACLPYRPFLALTLFLGPHTGEILITITNLQWFTAIALVQQALMHPPSTNRQRFGDIAIVSVVGLTGPFVAAFLPIFAIRWWVKRQSHDLTILITATFCTAVQAWFVLHGPHFDHPPFDMTKYVVIISQHLMVWPILGTHAAVRVGSLGTALLGFSLLIIIIFWSVRRGVRREQRLIVLAAFILLLGASSLRGRFDTYSLLTPWDSDRYFFVPRVMLGWLLIMEIGSVYMIVRNGAKVILMAIFLMHLPGYIIPTPPDFHWSSYCDSLRKGNSTEIPTLPEGWIVIYDGRRD